MRLLSALLIVVPGYALSARADTVQVFNFTNVSFQVTYPTSVNTYATATGSGSVTIDTTTGLATALDFTYVAPASIYGPGSTDHFTSVGSQVPLGDGDYQILSPDNGYGGLVLLLPVNTLVGYQGGALCTFSNLLSSSCGIVSEVNPYNPTGNSFQTADLAPGMILSSSPTPEPSSLVLLGTGALAATVVARRRFLVG